MLEEEERTPPDVFSDLSTVLLNIDLGDVVGGWRRRREPQEGWENGESENRKGEAEEGRGEGGG